MLKDDLCKYTRFISCNLQINEEKEGVITTTVDYHYSDYHYSDYQ